MSHARNLRIALALAATTLVAALAPSAQAATSVCNEASASQRGDLVAVGTPDPNPPARFQTELIGVGHGKASGKGLATAAERSPALTKCREAGSGPGGGVAT